MNYLPIRNLPLSDEQQASGEVAETFDRVRQMLGVPSVGVAYGVMALSPAALISGWNLFAAFMQRTTLPLPLLFMIHYTISTTRNCKYCSAGFKTACRSVGVDEAMLDALINDLDSVAPRRVREIIKFAVRCANDPQSLTEADYDRVREQGVSDEELVEIIGWAALAIYNDTLSDSLKVDDTHREQH